MARMRPGDPPTRYALVLCASALCGCGASQPPVESPADSPLGSSAASAPLVESVETGKDCATAEVHCGGGTCAAKINNACKVSIRCELSVTATCDAPGGSASDADGQARENFAAGSTGDMAAVATCTSGQALHTEARKLSCN